MADEGRRITPFNRRARQAGDESQKPANPSPQAAFSAEAARLLVGPGNRLNYRQARRISAIFTQVAGVEISAARLCDIVSGAPTTFTEYAEIAFAAIAVDIEQTRYQPWAERRLRGQAVIAAMMALGSLAVMLGMLVMFMFLAASGR